MGRTGLGMLTLALLLGGCRNALIGAPRFTQPGLELTGERLDLSCTEVAGNERVTESLDCAFEARYVVTNPGDGPVRAQAVVYARQAQELAAAAGDASGVMVPPEQAEALDALVRAAAPPDAGLDDWLELALREFEAAREQDASEAQVPEALAEAPSAPDLPDFQRMALDLELAPGEQRALMLRAWIAPSPPEDADFLGGRDPIETRHPQLGGLPPGEVQRLTYLFPAGRPAPFELQVRVPAVWSLEATLHDPRVSEEPPPLPATAWSEPGAAPELRVLRLDAPSAPALTLSFRRLRPLVRHGGPLLGAGGTDEGRGWLRLGYELGLSHGLVGSLSLDTDAKDQLVLAPVLEAATGSWLIFPSLAVGAGLALQIQPELEAGLRLQASALWPYLGIVASWDLYPAPGSGEARDQLSVLGRISF